MNARIANYARPVVAFMQGIVMGGGVGVAGQASHRIATEDCSVAMPETDIGYAPDVGATYLLSRDAARIGIHLALTAGRVGPADAIRAGLADYHVPKAALPALLTALSACRSRAEIDAAILAVAVPPAPGILAAAQGWIDACYGEAEVERILTLLQARPEAEAQAAAQAILHKSPTSLKVTLRALRQAAHLDTIEQCLAMEYRVAAACVAAHDFAEGVRAAIVDKDRQPRWQPATLAGVTPDLVERHFAVPPEGDWTP
jgi:enoyl-CoA hydratase